ncbi:MAG: DUF1016 domain-containing protein [Candidatus Omnitrophica bacterium]|nr:DUF1016 domain-containing protein [Candidatus Omnitrophota bacterium]
MGKPKHILVKKIIGKRTVERSGLPAGYGLFLSELKERIRSAQIKASVSVNRELILLYWDIGREILHRQKREGWGTRVINRIAIDLNREFPQMKGFSLRNLKYMRTFAEVYPDKPIVQQAVAQLPWGQNLLLIEKVKDPAVRFWYAHKAVENGWSRAVLWHQIDTKLYERQGTNKKLANFQSALPAPQSDLAHEMLKDPYNFDFLTLGEEAHERAIEKELLNHIQKFLVELGKGFAFVGNQYHLQVGDKDFYIDLLFYHLKLRCFIAIDLKTTEFQAEYAGKMNLYLSAVDDMVRHPSDQPTIGIILCKSKNKLEVEYALRDTHKPIGVSSYKLMRSVPKQLKGSLPTIEELEEELRDKKANH